MTISTLTIKNSYNGDGSVTAFNYTFKITDQDDIEVIIRAANGTETVKTLTTDYTVSGVGNAGGGTVTFVTAPASGLTVILRRDTPQTQGLDLIENDPLPANSLEDAFDKLTSITQELQEENDRSIKLSRTNTMTSTEFTVGASDRANKILAFDTNGELAVTQELGTFQGDWTTATTFNARDLVKDTTNNNIYLANTSHTSSGSLPISSNADVAKWDLIVDAASATSSATAAAASATAAASSATDAETAQTAAETAQTAAETAETNASTSETSAATSATNAATSASNASTSETNAANSATSASSSATTATTKASEASTSATNASTSATNASTSETNAATSASNASTSETNAATSASNASTSETNAATSATNASNAQTAAETAQSAAESAQASAEAAEAAALSYADNFDDAYLGAKSTDPTLDNDGDALADGALYFDTTNNVMKVYDLGTTTWYQLTPTVSNQTNINTVVGISSEIQTVAGDSADIQTVAADSTDIQALADIEDGTVATNAVSNAGNNATNITTVAGQISPTNNISTVAGISSQIQTVSGISSDVTQAATDSADIQTVATDLSGSDNIGTVATNIANVNNVGGNIANVNTVATNLTAINTANSNASNINTVATNIANVNNVSGDIANVNTVANNLSGVNSFAERYRVLSSDPSTDNDAGDLVFNTTASALKYFDGSTFQTIVAGSLTDIVQDGTPQLGGNLDLNSNDITGTGNVNITGDVTSTNFSGNGSSLTNLNASNIASGTISNDRLPSDITVGNNLTVTGDLTVNGTTVTINSTTLSVDDKNIELASVDTPTDITADGGGITIKGATDKTLNWVNSTDSFTSSENFDLATGKDYKINNTTVLSATQVLGKSLPTGDVIGTSDTQTLTNKTINSSNNTITITESDISDLGSYITASSTDTLTNKTFDVEGTGNSISNIDVADFKSGVLDTDLSSVSASDDTLASAKAIKSLVDTKYSIQEPVDALTGATGTVTHDLNNGNIFYHSSISANFTANFTNVDTTNNKAFGVTLILNQGATAYLPTAVQIAGSAQSIKWSGGSTPEGTASQTDVISFTLLRVGSAWQVLGVLNTFATP